MTNAVLLASAITSNGNLNLTTSNAGVVFNNSSALTNSTLNDYETGTYTITDQSGAGVTITQNTGYYIKIGRLVTVSFDFQFGSTSSSSSVRLNLPFTATSISGAYNGAAGNGVISYNSLGSTTGACGAYVVGGQAYFNLYRTSTNGSSVTNVNISTAEIAGTTSLLRNFLRKHNDTRINKHNRPH